MKKMMFMVFVLLIFSIGFAGEKWKVASLEWPPYAGKNLPEGGAAIVVLREVLKVEGIQLEVEYYPWTRAIDTAKDSNYLGYYPAYPEEVAEGFLKSETLFNSPLGFVEPMSKPMIWEKLDDLKGKRIGNVKNYGTTKEFEEKVKKGIILVEEVNQETNNISKVAFGRIDGALIDPFVLKYLLNNEAKNSKDKVKMNKKILENKPLSVSINKLSKNKNAQEIIKAGAAKVNSEQLIKSYFEKYYK